MGAALKKRGKKGTITIYQAFQLLFAGIIIILLLNFAHRAGTGVQFERVYVAHDMALNLNALYAVPGDVVLDHDQGMASPYFSKFTERINKGIVEVYGTENTTSRTTYLYAQSKSSVIDKEFTNPSYLSFMRQNGKVIVSETKTATAGSACPIIDTKGDVMEKRIIIEPGQHAGNPGKNSQNREEYKLTDRIARTIKLLCEGRGYECIILQQGPLEDKIAELRDSSADVLVSIQIGDSEEHDNPLLVKHPLGREKSKKLACIISNNAGESFDKITTEDVDTSKLEEDNERILLPSTEEGGFPAVMLEIGNIRNADSLSPNSISKAASLVLQSIEDYYRE